MVGVVGIFLGQLKKNFGDLPGWGLLLGALYLASQFASEETKVVGISVIEHREVIVAIAAAAAYQIGDALDKALFDRTRNWLRGNDGDNNDGKDGDERPRRRKWKFDPTSESTSNARKEMSVGGLTVKAGSRRVALAVLEAAKEYRGSAARWLNELAKFCRSAAPVLLVWPWVFDQPFRVWPSIALAVALLLSAIMLKIWHIRKTYERFQTTLKKEADKEHECPEYQHKFLATRLGTDDLLFYFWNSELVTSVRHEGQASHH